MAVRAKSENLADQPFTIPESHLLEAQHRVDEIAT